MINTLLCCFVIMQSGSQKESSKILLSTPGAVGIYLLNGPFLARIRADDEDKLKVLSLKIQTLMGCSTDLLEDGMIYALERMGGYGVSLDYLEKNMRAVNRIVFDVPTELLLPWKLKDKQLTLGTYPSFSSGPPTMAVTEFRKFKKIYRRRKPIDQSPIGQPIAARIKRALVRTISTGSLDSGNGFT